MELWNNLEGSVIEGRYPLRKLVRSEGRCAWFETQLGENGARPAIINLTESLNDQEAMLARLRAASQLRHPNVAAIEQTGVATVHKEPLVYAVVEYTEENLADVLRDRALSKEEARQLLDGMLAGLAAIHAKKLVHTRMEAASVLAAGNTIKLRSDCIQQPGSGVSFASLAAEDVRGMGAILFQALTQRQPQSASDPAISRLAAPFSQVVRRALSGQATTAEITALLQTEGRPLPIAALPTPVPAQIPARIRSSFRTEDEDLSGEDVPVRRNGPYIIVALVVVLLVVAWLLHSALRQQHRTPASVTASVPAASRASVPSTPPAAAPVATPAPIAPTPGVAAAAGHPAQPGWRVVAYTYNHQDQAQHKADTINKRYPGLQSIVFSPHGGAPYLVTLGGGPMDRSRAIQLRLKALKLGLAKDTYARNYR